MIKRKNNTKKKQIVNHKHLSYRVLLLQFHDTIEEKIMFID